MRLLQALRLCSKASGTKSKAVPRKLCARIGEPQVATRSLNLDWSSNSMASVLLAKRRVPRH